MLKEIERERERIYDSLCSNLDFLQKQGRSSWTCVTDLGYYKDKNRKTNRWAIVMGWCDYDGNGDERICAKVAFQPRWSLMQKYDIDWMMPYDEKTGEVDDTEIIVESGSDFKWLIDSWERIKEQLERRK